MPRDLRHVPPGTLLEITTRCIGEQHLMAPKPEVRDAILGVLGYALFLFPGIQLHGFIFLSNHYHLLLTAPDPETLARFMCFLNGNIARKVSDLIGHTGPFWSRRYADIPVVDPVAAVQRLAYLLANGCKEHLVASPLDWPGATCVRALVFGETPRGKWEDATGLSHARRRGEDPNPLDFTWWFDVPLSPLPCWQTLSEQERRLLCAGIVSEIEATLVGVEVVGAKKLIDQDPFSSPEHSKRSREPRCHASTEELWIIAVADHAVLRDLYRHASRAIRAGELPPTAVPAYTLPPPLHWRPDRNVRERRRVLGMPATC